MDALERKVQEHVKKADKSEWKIYADYAESVWGLVTGLEPSYSEVRKIERKDIYPYVIVEVDGVRLVAHLKYSKPRGTFHQWGIAEGTLWDRYLSTPDFTLYNLQDHLKRRRKRLKKRGLYEPQG